MRKNPIGHTIFLTCEKHRKINQKSDTQFYSQKRKIISVFPAFRGGHAKLLRVNVWNVPCLPENQQVKMSHSLCELRTGRAHDVEKPNLFQVSERKST